MYTVYETTNGAQAQLIVDVLGQAGIDAHVVGEHVAPYAGPLGSVRVVVDESQAEEARARVADWETAQAGAPPRPDAPGRPSLETFIVLGIAAALLLGLWYFTSV